MKLVRFGPRGAEKVGALDREGRIRDLSGHAADLAGETLTPEGPARLRAIDLERAPLAPPGVRLGACAGRVGGVAQLASYLSSFFTLEPGDIISSGAPKGVGLGQKPPVYLREGQTMRAGVDGLGEQRQMLVREAAP